MTIDDDRDHSRDYHNFDDVSDNKMMMSHYFENHLSPFIHQSLSHFHLV